MLVYREVRRRADARTEVRRLTARQRRAARGPADEALAMLIAAGEVESAISDALFMERDGVDERVSALRSISIDAARQYLDALAGRTGDVSLGASLDRLLSMALPRQIEMRPSEGYAYYALFPETYAASARRLCDDLEPRHVCVIGIRSIGTSLSAIVAAALRTRAGVSSYTVRPRGHPFDRCTMLDDRLRDAWRCESQKGASFAVVDEGPGLSGSSFASVVRALRDLDVPVDRIVLLPSWDPPPGQLRSELARTTLTHHRRYVTSAFECGITPETVFGIRQSGIDWSGGRWRSHVGLDEACWPAVQPQHERWKTWLPSEGRLLKFAGLGDYGADAFERARRLSMTGVARAAKQVRHGFVDLPFIDGAIATAPFSDDEAEAVGRYIAARAALCDGAAPADGDAIVEMVDTNVRELMDGEITVSKPALSRIRNALESAPAGEIDGRMQAHEWIRTRQGLMKVDAFEHGADHFFPGPQNPAWDLAGASLELGLTNAGVGRMIVGYKRDAGDVRVEERLPAYRIAYASFRGGYASMATEALAGSDDAVRFARVLAYYRGCLGRLIPSAL